MSPAGNVYFRHYRTKDGFLSVGCLSPRLNERFREATGLVDPNKDSKPTFPAWKPNRHLDFILHSPEITVNSFEVPDIHLSDHLPLLIDFDYPKEPAATASHPIVSEEVPDPIEARKHSA